MAARKPTTSLDKPIRRPPSQASEGFQIDDRGIHWLEIAKIRYASNANDLPSTCPQSARPPDAGFG
jgi:hypothetical protein